MNDTLATRPAEAPATPAPAAVCPGGVSVIVCTYNRRPLLEALADTIVAQLPVDYPLEVIVVDNNSRDDTAACAHALAERRPEFRYVFEPRQGLSHARNAGAAAANHEFLLYLDDDALAPPHYLPTLGRRLDQYDPDFFGGPLYPLYVDPKPDWFPESLEIRKKADRSGVDNTIVLTGANYGVRRSVLAKLGGFDPRYGMRGGKVGMLEERLVIETYRRMVPPDEQRIYYGLDHFILNQTSRRRMRVGFQLRRIFVGNAQFIRYCLDQGIRSPGRLLARVWAGFWGEVWAVSRMAPRLWRERRSDPEQPMLALVKLTYRGADLWGALGFFLTDFGRVRRRRAAEGAEDRPLRATLFTQAKLGEAGEAPAEIAALREALEGHALLEVVSIAGKSDDAIRRLAGELNLRAEDVILTDMPKACRALSVLRAVRPHLQIVLWIRDPKPLNYLKTLKHFWEKRQGALARLGRDRALVGQADQVVVAAPWLMRPFARMLLPMGRCALIASAPGAATDAAAFRRMAEGWRAVMEEARLWAPRRQSP
jgi:glycosyltransferase involved in cell wall biosynthesis